MITALSIDEIVQFLKATPEQAPFDWKMDFVPLPMTKSEGN